MLSSETKYKAACILEILTGQRVRTGSCEVSREDPLRRLISAEQQRDLDRVRGVAIRQSMQAAAGKAKKGQQPSANKKAPQISLTADDLRKLGNGFKIRSVMEGVSMYHFLEKCREFYLPDVIVNHSAITKSEDGKIVLPEFGHPNELKHSYVTGHFERFSPAKTVRHQLKPFENPAEASTSYLLKSSDLLKFPDIELFFESMGSMVSRDGPDDSSTLHLILRPTVKVRPLIQGIPELEEIEQDMGQVDNLKIMNYLLSQFFNMYMRRPRISGTN